MGYLMPKELQFKGQLGDYQKLGLNKIIINKLI